MTDPRKVRRLDTQVFDEGCECGERAVWTLKGTRHALCSLCLLYGTNFLSEIGHDEALRAASIRAKLSPFAVDADGHVTNPTDATLLVDHVLLVQFSRLGNEARKHEVRGN